MYDHLRRYGKIFSVEEKTDYAINILTERPIAEIISGTSISLEGINYEFTVSTMRHSEYREFVPVAEALIPAAHPHSTYHILNSLYYDVLRQIFEDPSCNLVQLVEIANTCSEFLEVARIIFRAKFKGVININRHLGIGPTTSVLRDFLRAFGVMISNITLHGSPSFLMRLVTRHCHRNIEEIICKGQYHLGWSLPSQECPRLLKLRLDQLVLNDVETNETFFMMNPQLEELSLSVISLGIDLCTMIRHLPNLVVLNVSSYNSHRDPYRGAFVDLLGDGIECFQQMTHLRSLTLSHRTPEIERILEALVAGGVQLERLDVAEAFSHRQVDLICRLTSLQWLRIYDMYDEGFERLFTELENLTEIDIKWTNAPMSSIRMALQSTHVARVAMHVPLYDEDIAHGDIYAINELRTSRSIDLRMVITVFIYQPVSLFLDQLTDFLFQSIPPDPTFGQIRHLHRDIQFLQNCTQIG